MGIAAAVGLGIVAILVFMIQPGYVQALVDLGRLTSATAGYVAASEMTGIAVTTILMSALTHRLPWRPLLILFILLVAAGNAACLVGGLPWLFGGRFVAGLGAGGLASLSFTAIGLTRNPDRQFGLLITWVLTYGALGLLALPGLLSFWGLDGLYLLVVLIALASLPLARHMPPSGDPADELATAAPRVRGAPRVLAIASMFSFFLACGILWAYLSLVGAGRGIADQSVANALSLSQFTGIAGALCATAAGSRFGRFPLLGGGILVCASSAACLEIIQSGSALTFAILVCLFNFAWNLVQPIYLASAASFDARGLLVTQMVGAQMTGLAVGPFFGASIVGADRFDRIVWSAAVLLGFAALLIAPAFRQSRRLAVS